MALRGKFFGDRDIRFINTINKELMYSVLQVLVTVFKVCADETQTNIYGEADPNTGKVFHPGVDVAARIEGDKSNTDVDDFGPDRSQNRLFKFNELALKQLGLFPQ